VPIDKQSLTLRPIEARRLWIPGAGTVVTVAALIKLLLHLYAARNYGYFIDELYYLACAQHLAWGYVDHPPLIAFIAKVARVLFGDSLQAIRLFPALAGAAKVVLTGFIARELGGSRFAQGLSAISVLVAPEFLAIDNWLSMNAFEPLFWMGCVFVIIRIIKTGDQKFGFGSASWRGWAWKTNTQWRSSASE